VASAWALLHLLGAHAWRSSRFLFRAARHMRYGVTAAAKNRPPRAAGGADEDPPAAAGDVEAAAVAAGMASLLAEVVLPGVCVSL